MIPVRHIPLLALSSCGWFERPQTQAESVPRSHATTLMEAAAQQPEVAGLLVLPPLARMEGTPDAVNEIMKKAVRSESAYELIRGGVVEGKVHVITSQWRTNVPKPTGDLTNGLAINCDPNDNIAAVQFAIFENGDSIHDPIIVIPELSAHLFTGNVQQTAGMIMIGDSDIPYVSAIYHLVCDNLEK